ncbi:Major facilitator superfamily MFS_1 [Candidatus Sulfopaludibacter sp. SbA3]|nr:Major facilitator superfamily MFS_1 [Candidatus Sulfopaludibacter sp. SbA3]
MTHRLRWPIAFLISSAIAISYFDRQTLPVAIAAIQREIPVSNTQFSQLQAAFLLAYAAMYAGGGKLIDLLGTRRGFLLIMLWWSLACASHGLAVNFAMLAASRFLLGMGEGGGFPAATKAVSEWFSVSERSLAMGIMNAGTAVGAVIAPPGIALVIGALNWRWVFFLSGAIGLLWTLVWHRMYFPPAGQTAVRELSVGWLQLFGYRQVWGLVIAKFLSDAAWYFYLFWLPKYLYDVRGFDVKQVGYYAWIPYAASGVGCLCGGWFSGRLLRAGCSLNTARKVALGASAGVMPLIFFVTQAPVQLAILLFSVAFFGQQSWSTLVMILPADLFPRSAVGSVAGLVGFGGAMGGLVFGLVVGYLLDHGFGYSTVFGIVSTLHVAAFGVILLAVPKVQPLE